MASDLWGVDSKVAPLVVPYLFMTKLDTWNDDEAKKKTLIVRVLALCVVGRGFESAAGW